MEAQAQAQAQHTRSPTLPPYEQWPSVPQSSPGVQARNNDTINIPAEHAIHIKSQRERDTSLLSMDDIEAAQALEGLRADALHSSQSRQPIALSSKIDPVLLSMQALPSPQQSAQQPEPLLSMLTSQHPLLSNAVTRSLSAYSTSKSYSSRFRYGAEFVERHIGSPVVNTVDTASRISGVQTGVRWWLQRNDSSTRDQNKKRRRIEEVNGDEVDVERGLEAMIPQDHIQRRFSELSFGEPLPAYDDQRAPNYQEKQSAEEHGGRTNLSRIGEWQRRLMMSTSGLSAALSEESLRNLRHCLQWLRWANNHISQKIMALREVLDGGTRPKDNEQHGTSENDSPATDKSDPSVISQRISALDRSIREALKHVIGIVDKFTGSALPENARSVVKRYIVTFPQRFQLVNMMARDEPEFSPQGPYAAHPPETIANSRRALVFALEGLNMLVQITTVLDGTIASAEDWIASFGRSVAKDANSDEKSARSPATDEKQVIKESPAQNERVVTDGISIPTRRSETLPPGTDLKMEKRIVADSADSNMTGHNSEHFVSS